MVCTIYIYDIDIKYMKENYPLLLQVLQFFPSYIKYFFITFFPFCLYVSYIMLYKKIKKKRMYDIFFKNTF